MSDPLRSETGGATPSATPLVQPRLASRAHLSPASVARHLGVALLPTAGTVVALALWAIWGVAPRAREGVLLAVFYVLNILGMELALHRYFAHRAFKATRAMHIALAVLGSLAYMGPLIWWVAIHRMHHAHTDQAGDPHTPRARGEGMAGRLKGAWHGHVGWLFAPDSARPVGWNRYAADLYRDPMLLKIHLAYDFWLALGLLSPMLIDGLIDLSWKSALLGLLWGGTVRIFLATNAIWLVNSAGHLVGRRPHSRRDGSRNLFWLALVTLGAGWHNNHHAFPQWASTRLRWWEIDITGWIISLLQGLGLVRDVQRSDATTPLRRQDEPRR